MQEKIFIKSLCLGKVINNVFFLSGDPDAAVVTRNTATKSDTKQLISLTKL